MVPPAVLLPGERYRAGARLSRDPVRRRAAARREHCATAPALRSIAAARRTARPDRHPFMPAAPRGAAVAYIFQDPGNGQYYDATTGQLVTPTGADILVDASYGYADPYAYAPTDGTIFQSIIVADPSALLNLGAGFTLNAPVGIQAGTVNIGTGAGTGTTTINGALTAGLVPGGLPLSFAAYNPAQINVSGNVQVNGGITLTGAGPGNTMGNLQLQGGCSLTVIGPFTPGSSGNVQYGGGSLLTLSGQTITPPQVNAVQATTHFSNKSSKLQYEREDIKTSPGSTSRTVSLAPTTSTVQVNVDNCVLTNTVVNATPATSFTATTFTDSNIQGNVQIPSTTYDTVEGTTGGPGEVDAQGDLGFGNDLADPITFILEPGSFAYGYFGVGAITVTIAPGSIIDVRGQSTFDFDPSYANSFTLQGMLELEARAVPYTFQFRNTAGTAQFAAGSTVTIGVGATLEENTALDNETVVQIAGGTFQLDQAPATLGTVQFYTANSTIRLGAAGSANFAPTGTLKDFSASDQVVWANVAYGTNAHVTLIGTTLSVYDQNGTLDGTFTLTRSDTQTYAQNDFALGSNGGNMALSVTGITPLAAPVVSAGATANFTGGSAPVALDPTLTLTDPGSAVLTSATVSDSNFVPGDTLGFTNQAGITGSYNAATGVLTLTGSAGLAAYQTALRSVTFGFTAGADPTAGGGMTFRTMYWTASDPSVTSLAATSALTVTPAAAAVTAGAAASYIAAGPAAVLDPAITVTDPDSPTLSAFEVSVGGSFAGNQDYLSANTTGTAITASFNAADDSLYLDGTDTLADYQTVLQSVAFASAGGDPSNAGANPSRSITWTGFDGVTLSNAAASTLTVAACFAAGTRIRTPGGAVAVEALRPGDAVLTAAGRAVPVAWLGYRHLHCRRHPNAERSLAGACDAGCVRLGGARARPVAFARARRVHRRRADPDPLPRQRGDDPTRSVAGGDLLARGAGAARRGAGRGAGLRELSRLRQPRRLRQWRGVPAPASRLHAASLGARRLCPAVPGGGGGGGRAGGAAPPCRGARLRGERGAGAAAGDRRPAGRAGDGPAPCVAVSGAGRDAARRAAVTGGV